MEISEQVCQDDEIGKIQCPLVTKKTNYFQEREANSYTYVKEKKGKHIQTIIQQVVPIVELNIQAQD